MRQGAGYDALRTVFVADVIRIPSSAVRVCIRSCNFATGHTFLRALHEAMLDGIVKPLVDETHHSLADIMVTPRLSLCVKINLTTRR
jgi:hypothetical protein